MGTPSKPALPKPASPTDSIPAPSDTEPSRVLPTPFFAAQTLAIADNLDGGCMPQAREPVRPLIHIPQKRDAYDGLGLSIPSPVSPEAPTSAATRGQKVATGDEIQYSRPIQIEAPKPSEEEDELIPSFGLSPAMQFLNVMNSPMSVSASPAGSRVTSSSLPPSEPERIGPYTLGPVIASGASLSFAKLPLQRESWP
jgi:hypothetical protein